MTRVFAEQSCDTDVSAMLRQVQQWFTDSTRGVATGGTGVDMSTPLLLEVAPEIDTNPMSFYRGEGWVRSLRLQTPIIGSRSVLAMSVHPIYFDLATPLDSTSDLMW